MEVTLTELDTIRAETMREYLNDEGQKEIWKYDVIKRQDALKEAIYDCDFDNLQSALETKKPYALVGPGICDTYFGTVEELKEAVRWLCCDAYLSCYKKEGVRIENRNS